MSTFDTRSPFSFAVCERLDPDDVYCVRVECIVRLRDGQSERLEGAEKERVRRWLFRWSSTPTTGETEGA